MPLQLSYIYRRARAYWAVKGPELAFVALVLVMMIGFGVWQFAKYLTFDQYTPAFEWGAVLAKICAGVLYPTFFLLILSMSCWLSTFLRRFYLISRFINWDLSQSFNIKMSILALFFATLHPIGHLSGSFVFGSMASRQGAVANIIGQDAVPRYYIDYVRSLPGCYEVFQLGHLLMFPIIGLMMAHGTAHLLQWPMFGYWLIFPTQIVLFERIWRIILDFRPIVADLELLDDETVVISAQVPKTRPWDYKAGQYVFVQVLQLSRFQWHPFTVSTCINNTMQVHIKADGDWTNTLRDIAQKGQRTTIKIGLDGPFGAPAQRFYDYDYSICRYRCNPFSGVLTDLQHHELERVKSSSSPSSSSSPTRKDPSPYTDHRRVDFHWMVRDKNNLLWFSDLLNQVTRAQELDNSHLDIRINTYVTQKRKQISQHSITGLLNPTRSGRPDIRGIMEEHYEDMCKVLAEMMSGEKGGNKNEVKVGVFFCGPPVIGQQITDQCSQFTARARNEDGKFEYRFMVEMFG
ncbi:hypothetical protein EJ02DRAFT_503651 [Clathrospora elynae]|uniref:FAD-binding FR-type domain-containing protein n=1 Tax=Clathrospora elynae TaxID=706981 RepID=A0A6A5SKL8_9PLEO|nr:hypothetical protein EJ02DRAFT_503651 [Clathrospora elynae]